MSTLTAVGIFSVLLSVLLLLFRHPLERWNTRAQNKYFTPRDDPRPPVTEGYTYKSIVGIAAGIGVVGLGLIIAGLLG